MNSIGSYALAGYPVGHQSRNEQPQQSTVLAADQMSNGNPGLDCGEKINLADASLGARSGTIDVSRSCGMTWSSPVTLSPGHNLQITQPGTYIFEGIFAQGQNRISGLGSSTTLKLAPQEWYPLNGIAGIRLSDADDRLWAAKNVTVSNLVLDGDHKESEPCQNELTCATAISMRGTATSQNSDITISHVLFTGWAGLDIQFGNRDFPPSNILITHNIFKNCITQCIESSGFRNNVEILNNQFLGWGVHCPAKCDAIFMYPNLPQKPAYDQRNLKIIGNTFINLHHASKFATELFGGSDAGARFTDVTYANNYHDDLNSEGGGSGFSATILHGIISRNVWKNGCGGQRCGLELAASDVLVSGNEIYNGTISIGGKDNPHQLFRAYKDTVSQNKIFIAAPNGKGIKVASVSGATINGNSISIKGSQGSCDAIIIGIRSNDFGTVKDIHIEGNTITGSADSDRSPCSGVRIADSPEHPGSAIVVAHNTIRGLHMGVLDTQNSPSLKDITVDTNAFINTAKAIHLAVPGAKIKLYGNTAQ